MAALAIAVAACAHYRLPAHSLSRPIYLTQTTASRPGPAYLSSAWFSLGVGHSPVPLHPGIKTEVGGGVGVPCAAQIEMCICKQARLLVYVEQFVTCCLSQKMATTDSCANNQSHCQTSTHTAECEQRWLSLCHHIDLSTPTDPSAVFHPALASIPQQTSDNICMVMTW